MINQHIGAALPAVAQPQERAPIGPFQRLIGTLIAPRKTFQEINRKPAWVLPVLLAIITTLGANFIVASKLKRDPETAARQIVGEQQKSNDRSPDGMSERRQERIERNVGVTARMLRLAPIVSAALTPVAITVIALLFWMAASLIDRESAYPKIFSVTAHVFGVVFITVPTLLKLVVAFLRDPGGAGITRRTSVTSLSMLLPSEGSPVMAAFLSQLDLFSIWFLILMSIGLAAVCKNLRLTRAATIAFGTWAIWVLLRVTWVAVVWQ